MRKNVAIIPQRDLCCSCGACSGVCRKGAINYVFKHGLFIPEIDNDACIGCGLCFRVCPSAQLDVQTVFGEPELFSQEEKESYIAFSKNQTFRHAGTSGGVVSTLVYELLRQGVYEKAYILDFESFDGEQAVIRPTVIPDDVIKSTKSKYVPASVEEVIKDVFCGGIDRSIVVATPCQLLAIKESFKVSKRKEDSVLFIGLFCDKTLNYNIYGYYREKFGDYDSFHFRDKDGNDWPGDTVLYKKGKKVVIDKLVRLSLKPFFQLNRCRFCFDKLNQLADISCGDCYIKGEESQEGKSSIIVRSLKGKNALSVCASNLELKESSLREIKLSQLFMKKMENYRRNAMPGSPFIISSSMSNDKGLDASYELKKIHLGKNATDKKGYSKIDNYIARENKSMNNSWGRKIFNRIRHRFFEPDCSKKILIDNAGFINKGAELMLQSVVQQLESITPNVRIVVPKSVFYENLDYCYLHHILPLEQVPRNWRFRIKKFVYQDLLNKRWFVFPDQIDVILDAGGFQFSDQWKVSQERLDEKRKYYSLFTKKNHKVVFLPQAFGPFEQPMSRQLMEIVYKSANILYARELTSFNYLKSLFPDSDKIKIAPDFTCLSRSCDGSITLPSDYVVLIPNMRMISHTTRVISDHYFSFLLEVSDFLISKGESLVLLNHEGRDDLLLLRELNDRLSERVLLLSDLDALEVKRVIGGAKLLISSRFHGVVSGLTQRVPVLCTSWSHKYIELLKDFGCEKGILSIDDLNRTKQTIDEALKHPSEYSPKEESILSIKKKSFEMWNEIWDVIDFK